MSGAALGRSGAVLALRSAIRAALVADPALVEALGGPHVYDDAPRDLAPPYVTFGATRLRDWSTSSDRGAEQHVELDVWGGADTMRPALNAASAIVHALDDATLVLNGHRLVDLRFASLETRRERNGRMIRVAMRFRALTEEL